MVVSCSALKRKYRNELKKRTHDLNFLYLEAPREIIAERLAARERHYMPPVLLDSQLAILEPPDPDESAVIQSVTSEDLDGITRAALTKLRAL